MNPLLDIRVRQLLPRWRDSATTAELGEIADLPMVPRRQFDRTYLDAKYAEWRLRGGVALAADVLASAIVIGDDAIASEAAGVLSASVSSTEVLTLRLLRRAGSGLPKVTETLPSGTIAALADYRARVRRAKQRLQRDYHNALAWVDVAQAYAAVGVLDKAEAAITQALALAPNDRFVLRCAARFYVHDKKSTRGLWLLRRAAVTGGDPWLTASEISIAALLGERSALIRKARAMTEARQHSDFELSELRAALATLDAMAGKLKNARQLFRKALIRPNDNVVAQALWAHRYLGTGDVLDTALNVPRSFEARARRYAETCDWADALDEIVKWIYDQPFSAAPAIHGSYVASVVIDNHTMAIDVAQLGMLANPKDWTLRNNLVFSLASLDRLEEAQQEFASLSPEHGVVERHGIWLATGGLLSIRSGDSAAGIYLYDKAIQLFGSAGLLPARASASFFKARELSRIRHSDSLAAIEEAAQFLKLVTLPERDVLLDRLEQFASSVTSSAPTDDMRDR